MERGQGEVMGLMLLFGIVIIGATTIGVAALVSMDSVEEDTESELNLQELQGVAHDISSIDKQQERRGIGVHEGYNRVEGGQLTIEIDGKERYNRSIGRLVNDDLVYEGGIIIQDGKIISSPSFETLGNSTRFIIPKLVGNQLNNNIQVKNVSSIHVNDPTSNVTVRVQSQYADAWYEVFEGVTGKVEFVNEETVEVSFVGGSIQSGPSVDTAMQFSGEDGEVSFGELGALTMDSYDSLIGEYSSANSNSNGNISSPSGFHFAAGGGGNLNLDIARVRSGGSITSGPHDVETVENIDNISTPVSTSEIINEQDAEQGQEISDISLDEVEDGGAFHTKSDLTITDENLRIGNSSSIFVDGYLTIDDATITVEDELRLYVNGEVEFGDSSVIETADNRHRANKVSVYSTGDIIAGESVNGNKELDDITVTGLIHASDSTLYANGNLTNYGSLTLGDVQSSGSANNGDLTLHHDESLIGTNVYGEHEPDMSMESKQTRDSYYLKFVVRDIDIN